MNTALRAARDILLRRRPWSEGYHMGREYWHYYDNIRMGVILTKIAGVIGIIFSAGFLAGKL